jgi:glutathione-regulated potassium-efflux system ancillary protein KefG
MKNNILIIFAHPRFEKSVFQAILIKHIPNSPAITFHDLYERYPDFNIDVDYEQKLLEKHNIIIWQHPFYWFSSPPLLKQWIDVVMDFGWLSGPSGPALKGKIIFNVISTGGQRPAYGKEGHNRFTVQELLSPFDQTAFLCKMIYLPPFALHGTYKLSREEGLVIGVLYKKLLEELLEGNFSTEEIRNFPYLNDWIISKIN